MFSDGASNLQGTRWVQWTSISGRIDVNHSDPDVLGEFEHRAYTYDGATRSVYIKGDLDATGSQTGTIDDGGRDWVLGGQDHNSITAEAQILDFRYYERALHADEIHALWSPSSRWDLYHELGRRLYFFPQAAAAATLLPHTLQHGLYASGLGHG